MAAYVVYTGERLKIEFAICLDRSLPAKQFFDRLDAKDQRKLMVLFQWLADHGKIFNEEKFKKIEGTDGLFEFKSFQIRMPGFFGVRGSFVVTHGFRKKRDEAPRSEITKAYNIRAEHLTHSGN
jgi:phage-related protein